MSTLSVLNDHLQEFWQLEHHRDSDLAQKLLEVQNWQKNRMRQTHEALFSEPKNKPMAAYFLNQLYGGESFDTIAEQLARIVPKAQKIEKIAPSAALQTGAMGIEAAITATKLDLQLTKWLFDNNLEVNAENMATAYRTVNAAEARRQQIYDLKDVCYRTDKYLNSFLLKKAFKLAKNQAYKHNLAPLYDFIDAGFEAMKPLKSVSKFIDPFCEGELEIIEEIHKPI